MNLRNKKLIILLLLVFLVSFAYSFYFRIEPAVDARAYDTIARHVVEGHGYREWLDRPIAEDNSIIRVGPGYEFFLAALYFLFGRHYEVVWVVQALFMALSAYLVFLTTKEVFGDEWRPIVGYSAAMLVGFSPDLITMQGMLMTETLGIFLMVLTVYLFFHFNNLAQRSEETWSVGAAVESARQGGKVFEERLREVLTLFQPALIALVLGLATLVRTPTILLALPMGVYLLWHKRGKEIFVMAVVGTLVFIPWTARNYRVFGEFIPTNLASGFNLLAGNHPGANGEQEPYPILDQYVRDYGYVEANRRATNDTLTFIKERPFEYTKLTLLRASIYFSAARPTGFWFHLSGLSKAITLATSALYAAVLFVFGFWGISSILRTAGETRRKGALLLSMLVMMPLAIVGVIVETRYRMPVYPFFAIFAGFGVLKLRERQTCLVCFALIAFLFFANTAFDITYNIDRIIEKISGI